MNLQRLALAALAAGAVLGGPAHAADYDIDIEDKHASVHFKANHLGYSYIVGRFNHFTGEFSHERDNPAAARVEVTIDAASVDTNHAERDKHIRGDDFFDVARHPTITFRSTGFDGTVLRGELTFIGVTRPVTMTVRRIGEGKDPWGGYRAGFIGTMALPATDFGLPKWVGTVDIEVIVEGVRR